MAPSPAEGWAEVLGGITGGKYVGYRVTGSMRKVASGDVSQESRSQEGKAGWSRERGQG